MGGCVSFHAVDEEGQGGRHALRNRRHTNPAQLNSQGRLSRPVKLPTAPAATSNPVSSEELATIRCEFWGTQVEGDEIVWVSIRAACESILSADEGFANAILEAANITTPNGDLSICYDERGHMYKVPLYCYCSSVESTTVRRTNSNQAGMGMGTGTGTGMDAVENISAGSSSVVATTVGSSVVVATNASAGGGGLGLGLGADDSGMYEVEVRLNPGAAVMKLQVSPVDTILDLKNRIRAEAETKNLTVKMEQGGGNQRIICMGKELKNDNLLSTSTGLQSGKVLQCFVR